MQSEDLPAVEEAASSPPSSTVPQSPPMLSHSHPETSQGSLARGETRYSSSRVFPTTAVKHPASSIGDESWPSEGRPRVKATAWKDTLPHPGEDSENTSSTHGQSGGMPMEFEFTKRFEHQEGGGKEGNWVLTGYENQLERCEDEPIHAPGAIQAFGVLMCFDEEPGGNLKIQQVSENSRFILGLPPQTLFACSSFLSLLAPSQAEVLVEALDALIDANSEQLNFLLSGEGLPGTSSDEGAHTYAKHQWTCHAVLHKPDPVNRPGRVILELELVDDPLNPLKTTPMRDEGADVPMGRGAYAEHKVEEKNTLRTLRRFRMRKQEGSKEEIDVVGLLGEIGSQLSKIKEFDLFLISTAKIIKELTEFDRVMIYQFDRQWNGKIVAEEVDWNSTNEEYHGLSFPASDIPVQARELYKLNKIRLLYDRDQPTARMCCRNLEEVQTPLNMTHCQLRAMSPVHIKYMGNMGVRSSMSISITAFGELWGLVALHNYGKFGHRASFPIRQFCKLLGDNISKNVERLTYTKRLQARKLINPSPNHINPSGYILAKAEDLLSLFDADLGVLAIGDEAKILGEANNSQELLAILSFLRTKRFESITWTRDLSVDYPQVNESGPFEVIAGCLIVPLSREGQDFIVFCRKGEVEEVTWAGNPLTNKLAGDDYKPLEPRTSFKAWLEITGGKSREWTDDQIETAGVLCLVYGKFIDVWRQKESVMEANRLTHLLLSNAGHEVRTPLNAIINCLEIALDSPLQEGVRENITKSYDASRSLIHVINDLLDLTRTDKGTTSTSHGKEPFQLPSTILDALSLHKEDAAKKRLTLEVVESPSGTPPTVIGDRVKVKHIVANIIANAVKHSQGGGVMVEWGEIVDEDPEIAVDKRKDSIRIRISVTDTGPGISEADLELIFREFEQTFPLDPSDAKKPMGVGLGLAIVARLVRTLNGQLQVETQLGFGSRFTVILPFKLPSLRYLPATPNPETFQFTTTSSSHSSSSSSSITPESMLKVDGGKSTSSRTISNPARGTSSTRRSGGTNTGSFTSIRTSKLEGSNSSTTGKLEYLIHAMSTSHMVPLSKENGLLQSRAPAELHLSEDGVWVDQRIIVVPSISSTSV